MLVLWIGLGLVVGGLLNVLISRLPYRGGPRAAPLHCHTCGHELAVADALPLLGFFLQRGRCRYCGKPIPWRYPLVELATAALFALAYLRFGLSVELVTSSLFTAILVVIFMIDLRHRLILNTVTYPAAVLGFVLAAITPGMSLLVSASGGLAYGGLFVVLYLLAVLIYRRGDALGMGDVKLAIVIGLMAGLPRAVVAVVLGILLGAVAATAVLITGRKGKQDVMPYGTALSIGGMLAILYGDLIINWYIGAY